MPTTIWTGSISFGLVTVPVKLTAGDASTKDVSFNQLEEEHRLADPAAPGLRADRRGGHAGQDRQGLRDREGPVRRRREGRARGARAEGEPHDRDRGLRRPRRDRPDLLRLPVLRARRREGGQAVPLLVEAMTELQKVAIGRVVMRAKERLVAIRPLDGMLCVETMRYADEIVGARQARGIPDEDVEVSERELAMATQLVESLAGDFEPEKYHDEYREQVLDAHRPEGRGRGDRRPARARGAGQGARPHGRARSEPEAGRARRRGHRRGRRRRGDGEPEPEHRRSPGRARPRRRRPPRRRPSPRRPRRPRRRRRPPSAHERRVERGEALHEPVRLGQVRVVAGLGPLPRPSRSG